MTTFADLHAVFAELQTAAGTGAGSTDLQALTTKAQNLAKEIEAEYSALTAAAESVKADPEPTDDTTSAAHI